MATKIELGPSIWNRIADLRQNDLDLLAPKFRQAIEDSLDEISGRSTAIGSLFIPLDVIVFETARSNELQGIYFAQGTSKAKTAEKSWHFYGLAIDVISIKYEWFGNAAAKKEWPELKDRMRAAEKWFSAVGNFFKANGCALGLEWKNPDMPHIQWGKCKPTPGEAPVIYHQHGLEAVWRAVGAI